MEFALTRPQSSVILSNMPLPLLTVDGNNCVNFANEACESFLGKAKRRIEGQQVFDILHFASNRLNRALLDGENDLTAQDMLLKIGQSNVNVDISISSLPEQEGEQRLIILIPRNANRDHIGNDAKAGIRQSMGAPAILGHEIKNPLAGIRGAAQLLARGGNRDQKPLTELIVDEVDRIARLLDQMQNLGGSVAMKLAPENIHVIIERAVGSVRAANRAMPDIAINYDPSLPDVMIDADAMLQIIINLLQNSIDALEGQEEQQIGISTRYVMSGALRETFEDSSENKTIKLPVEITISDNGPGIPDDIGDELFSPFVSSKRDGQGLGLAIVRKLVRQMKSRVRFERDAAAGQTLFRLYLRMTDSGAGG
ncbi:MAG: ATP-binding protein [Sphingorhabdus sp.]